LREEAKDGTIRDRKVVEVPDGGLVSRKAAAVGFGIEITSVQN